MGLQIIDLRVQIYLKTLIFNPVSLLALRAVMAAASTYHDAFNRSFADQARLTFAPINPMFQLEETFFAVSVHVI